MFIQGPHLRLKIQLLGRDLAESLVKDCIGVTSWFFMDTYDGFLARLDKVQKSYRTTPGIGVGVGGGVSKTLKFLR